MAGRGTTELPERVAAYLERNLPAASRGARRVELEQTGTMRLKPGGRAIPFTAEQWIDTGAVGFCWHARFRMAPLVTAVVEDAYEDGHGRLDVKVWGKLPVAHAEGPVVDRGEVQRYLAELVWAPGAFAQNEALRYEERGDAVRVWTLDPDTYVDLFFDDHGDVCRTFTTTRARSDGAPVLEAEGAPWEGRFFDYAERGGVRLPTRGEVAWLLPEGRFDYWQGEIVTARFS